MTKPEVIGIRLTHIDAKAARALISRDLPNIFNHTVVFGNGNILHDISISKNDSPVQPELLKFPVTNDRRFNTKYYKDYEWLEYSVSKDSLFYFVCWHFGANILSPVEIYGSYSFVNNGNNCKKWKEIKAPLDRHQRINRHIISMQRWQNKDYLLEVTMKRLHQQIKAIILNYYKCLVMKN
ncbi:Uncharacterized protein FWK35_00030974 [Aphis craccivora]|uniref:Zinc finger MYM-type protein 1-like n=1 Tax=Aphis craccivora TaxID=307492 RepID=A0A6G0VX31_APHCR|nr:Uncharacterized protein FWK35_00030974 [Aphis craccivora]